MKVTFRVTLIVISAAVLQRGLFSQLRIAHVAGDILLLLAIAAGITGGPDRGAIMGFVCGLTLDLLLQSPLGLTALTYCLVGFVAGRYQISVVRSSRWRPMFTAAVGSAMGYGLYILLGWMLGQRNMLANHLPTIILVVSLINGLLAPLAVRVMRWAWDEPTSAAYPALRRRPST